MTIDTSMYRTVTPPGDPLEQAAKAMQMRDKIQRGSPQTESSLSLLGAGTPYIGQEN